MIALEIENLRHAREDLQEITQASKDAIKQELNLALRTIMQEIIAEQGIDLIVRSESVYFAAPGLDLTALVTQRLNAWQ